MLIITIFLKRYFYAMPGLIAVFKGNNVKCLLEIVLKLKPKLSDRQILVQRFIEAL